MRFIPWRVMASFVIGLLVGGAALNLVSGTHLDNAQLEIERLNAQLTEKSEQISALEEAIAQHEKWAVTEIEVQVSFKNPKENDELHTLEIEKTVKELLKNIRGRQVSTLDPTLVFNIVNGRTIEVSNLEYTIAVKSVLISEKLIMHVEAATKNRALPSATTQSTATSDYLQQRTPSSKAARLVSIVR